MLLSVMIALLLSCAPAGSVVFTRVKFMRRSITVERFMRLVMLIGPVQFMLPVVLF